MLINIAAAIIVNKGKVFIAQRAKPDGDEGLWEFPGGKAEEGETLKECLKRELMEEFGIEVKVGRFLTKVPFTKNNKDYVMHMFLVPSFKGEIELRDHKQADWISLDELYAYPMPEPDKPVFQWLIEHPSILNTNY